MSASDRVIVIGGGPNGLTTAARLARRGRRVLLLERQADLGGLAAADGFHPGYESAGVLHDEGTVWPRVVHELELARFGATLANEPPTVWVPGDGAPGLSFSADPTVALGNLGTMHPEEAARYAQLGGFLGRIRPAVDELVRNPPIDLVHFEGAGLARLGGRALRLRRLARRELTELLRIPPMPVADWLGEWLEEDRLKAALALPAIAGACCGPRQPGTTAALLLHAAAPPRRVKGGGAALVCALAESAKSAGAELRTEAEVAEIQVDGNGVRGVRLVDGEELAASAVVAACDPKHALLSLVPDGILSFRLQHRLTNFRTRGTTAQLLLALDRPAVLGDDANHADVIRTAAGIDDLERAFDPVKYRQLPGRPALEIERPSRDRPERAPDGGEVLSVQVHFVPYDLEGGWTEEAREQLIATTLSEIDRFAPGTSDGVVGRQLLAPPDLERRFGVTGGHLDHGEHGLDQLMMRPVPDCVGYVTPIEGLYLGSPGSHPGGGLSCVPGWLAADAVIARR